MLGTERGCVSWIAGAIAVALLGCGGGQSTETNSEDPALARCAASYVRSNSGSRELRDKLSSDAQMRLQRWLGDVGFARCAGDEKQLGQLESHRVAVTIHYRGSQEALVAAGAKTSSGGAPGEVHAVIEVRRMLELAAVPGVTQVAAEPLDIKPN